MHDKTLQKELETIGLSKNEALAYLALQKSGKAKAGEIIHATGLHRHLVYQALASLGQKRLLTKSTQGSVALFQATDPEHLFDGIREQQLTTERVVEELKAKKKIVDQEITIYEGAEGIRAYCLHNAANLKPGQYIHVIGTGGPRLEKAMGAQAIKKYFSLIEKNGGIKVLAYQTQQYTESMLSLIRNKPMFEFRLLPVGLTPAAGIIFTDESVGFIIYEGAAAVIEVKNVHLVEAYKQYFNLLWDQDVRVEQGVDAIRRAFMNILDELKPGDEYYSIGTQTGEPGSDLAKFFEEYHAQRVKKGITCKLLSYKQDTEVIRNRYHLAGDPEEKISHVKPLRQTTTGFIQTMLFNNKVLIPIYGDRPMVMLFENPELYQGFKDYFDELWNTKTQTFEGNDGIIALCETVLQEQEDLYLIAATGNILTTHPEYYKEFTKKRKAAGIELHALANESVRYTPFANTFATTVSYLPPEFESPMVVWVFGDYVANVLWSDSPRVFLTEDRKTADAYRKYHDALKKIARP